MQKSTSLSVVVAAVMGLYLGTSPLQAASVSLAWDAPTTNTDGSVITDLAGYKLYRGTTSGNYTVVTNVGNVTAFTVANLTEGQTYYFSAKAYNAALVESGYAAQFTWLAPDVTPPVITPPAAPTIAAGATGTANVPNLVAGTVVTDNVSAAANIVVTQAPTAGSAIGLGATAVTLTARDQAGNSAQAVVQVTVVDQTAPVITTPAPVSVTAAVSGLAAVPNFLTSLVVSDNCTASGSIVKTQTPTAGTQVAVGTHTVTIRATDAAGNQAQTTVTLTVLAANQAPVVSAGPDQTIRVNQTATLAGSVTDDGLPTGATVTRTWTKVSGPGTVTFGVASMATTTATFSAQGTYVLRLTGNDTLLSANDSVTVVVLPLAVPAAPGNLRVTTP